MAEITITTTEDIRSAVRDELAAFFSNFQFQPKTETDQIGGIELAMEITGKAKPTIYSLVSRSAIPCKKRGKKLYFSRNELTRWILDGKRKTQAESAIEAENHNN